MNNKAILTMMPAREFVITLLNDDNTEKESICFFKNSLYDKIAEMYDKGITEFIIFGPQTFAKKYQQDIKKYFITQYNNYNIKVYLEGDKND